MIRITSPVILFVLALSIPALAAGKEPAEADKKADGETVDITAVADKIIVLADGKQHYIAVVPSGDLYSNFFYGDGKKFYKQYITGGSRAGTESWDRIFWEPRVDARWKAGFGFKKGKYTVQCGDRATEFKPLAADEQANMLKAASFFKTLWNHQPYSLARDNKGNYFYVDRLWEPENNKNFRLFSGPRGNLKVLKMTNVVSDSQGDIFTTKKGELRLVLDRKKSSWHAGKAETDLINLPIDENQILIYSDLGVYAGQRLGTPCDDLL
jgi:hypothetical protein